MTARDHSALHGGVYTNPILSMHALDLAQVECICIPLWPPGEKQTLKIIYLRHCLKVEHIEYAT